MKGLPKKKFKKFLIFADDDFLVSSLFIYIFPINDDILTHRLIFFAVLG